MKISTAIMAHPRRADMVATLRESLDRSVEVVWDEGKGVWDTGRRALLAYDPAATHHLVLQDDSIVCPHLHAGLETALRHIPPDVPVSPYLGRVRPQHHRIAALIAHAEATDAAWIVSDGPLWGVAVCIPTPVIETMVAFCDRRQVPNYDRRLGDYWRHRKVRCWYPYPSLVDHRRGHGSILSGPKAADRYAHLHISGSPLAVDWSRLPVAPHNGLIASRSAGRRWHCWTCTFSTASLTSARRHVRRCSLTAQVESGR